eukprot:9433300-Alexandrium_andersonii.AAC.1
MGLGLRALPQVVPLWSSSQTAGLARSPPEGRGSRRGSGLGGRGGPSWSHGWRVARCGLAR